jgi:uncharacterized SAM-binding protein YcdF (DUF218 family)
LVRFLIIGLLLVGLILIWYSRKQKAGKIIITSGVALLLILSYATVPDFFLSILEYKYKPLINVRPQERVKWVVVLGGSHTSDPELLATGQITGSSLLRLAEGIRFLTYLPECKLILAGGSIFEPKSEAKIMAEVAVSLGLDHSRLVLESVSKDTKDQAKEIRKIVGTDRFILVTSASHMPRTMALFRKKGMEPIPAPTDFWVKEKQGVNPGSFFPRIQNLKKMERAVHEYLGILWAKLRGQI